MRAKAADPIQTQEPKMKVASARAGAPVISQGSFGLRDLPAALGNRGFERFLQAKLLGLTTAIPGSRETAKSGSGLAPKRKGGCGCGGSCPKCLANARAGQVTLAATRVDDSWEEEAQRVAAGIQRQAALSSQPGSSGTLTISQQTASSIMNPESGAPLAANVRSSVEPHLGADLRGVCVHMGSAAQTMAQELDARAFTYGRHIWLGPGESQSDLGLMAHELTHVVQQASVPFVARQPRRPQRLRGPVSQVEISCPANSINLQTATGLVSYTLTQCELDDGDYTASVSVVGNDVRFNLRGAPQGRRFLFNYTVGPGQPNPAGLFSPGQSVRIVARGTGTGAGGGGQTGASAVQVQVLTPAVFQSLTGQATDQLPAGRYIPASSFGASQAGSSSTTPGLGMGMFRAPMPSLPVPSGSTGVIWVPGAHLSDFAVLGGNLQIRGFRGPLLTHARSVFERSTLGELLYGPGRGPATIDLNRGIRAAYESDWFYPYLPGAKAIFPQGASEANAAAMTQAMQSATSTLRGQTYTFSTVPESNPYFATSYKGGCPPGVANCIALPEGAAQDLHQLALGGHRLVLQRGGQTLDIATGQVYDAQGNLINPSEVDPAIWNLAGSARENVPGAARNMDAYIRQSEEALAAQGLSIRPTPGAMWARVGVGFIRVGGGVLLLYGAYGAIRTAERIADAPPEQQPVVISEEIGSWGGGFIGNVLGSALGGAFVCSETGPGAFVCALAFGIAGGVTGSVIGQSVMHDVGQAVVDFENMTPGQLVETTTRMFGTPEQLRQLHELREIETGQPDPTDF
jgi:hypothetical protein